MKRGKKMFIIILSTLGVLCPYNLGCHRLSWTKSNIIDKIHRKPQRRSIFNSYHKTKSSNLESWGLC